MNNPNSAYNRLKENLSSRWMAPDIPGMQPRFQVKLLLKDLGRWIVVPLIPLIAVQMVSQASSSPKKHEPRQVTNTPVQAEGLKPQVIEFNNPRGGAPINSGRRAPGTLVRVRLLNVVETYSAAPVHAQIVDLGLGRPFLGGELIGDGIGDPSFNRLNITFKIARDPLRPNVAFPISARALSLNGTLGLEARQKEGAFARAVFGTGAGASQITGGGDSIDLKSIVLKALSTGLAQELGNQAQIESNRAGVLSLRPGVEFFAELSDYFPTAGR